MKFKRAPILFMILQILLLSLYREMNPALFDFKNNQTFYILITIILTFTFYLFTAYKDPGFLSFNDYQYTDSSNPYSKKRESFHANSHFKTANMHQEEQLELQIRTPPKIIQVNKGENPPELDCEQSVDEHHNPEYDLNQIHSFAKTPEKQSKFQTKTNSNQQSPHELKSITKITILSEDSTKTDTQQPQQVQQANLHNLNETADYHSPNINDKHVHPSEQQGQSMFIERRYCPLCNLDQIVRSKHCRHCNKCVGLFDHHCPWASNCIGEKNRCAFYWFLVFQTQEMVAIQYITYRQCDFNNFTLPLLIIIILGILITVYLTLMVISLLLFHSLLSLKNMTTWEYKSWRKISYLQDFPQKLGSPFSKGWKQNLREYCRFSVPKLTQWEYNTQKLNIIK